MCQYDMVASLREAGVSLDEHARVSTKNEGVAATSQANANAEANANVNTQDCAKDPVADGVS